MRFSVDQETLQAVLNYLVEKPFKETNALITKLQTDSKPIKEEKAPEAQAE